MPKALEINFDCLIGPTHHYGGLARGNEASQFHYKQTSSPKRAALQGLEKMKFLSKLGIPQAVIPPHMRPHFDVLKNLGFLGNPLEIAIATYKRSPILFSSCTSSSFMWSANAATITPSWDTLENIPQITPANLVSHLHRSIESETTYNFFKTICPDFHVHPPLHSQGLFGDEGAANHTRFCRIHGEKGVHFFVYGKSYGELTSSPKQYPSRQTDLASRAICRLHQLPKEQAVFAQQAPEAIDAGVFHNDVVSTGHRHVFLYHELAFLDQKEVLAELRKKIQKICQIDPIFIPVEKKTISLNEAIQSYLFNSQIVSTDGGDMIFIAPQECKNIAPVHQFIEEMIQSPNNPINSVYYINLNQSMNNGGGPACLRLRVTVSEKEKEQILPSIFLTDTLYNNLKELIHTYYKDRLELEQILDKEFLIQSRQAVLKITQEIVQPRFF